MHLLYGFCWYIKDFFLKCTNLKLWDNGTGYNQIPPFIIQLHKENNIQLAEDEIKEINSNFISFVRRNPYNIKYSNLNYIILNTDHVFYGIEIKQKENSLSRFDIKNLVSNEQEQKMREELRANGFYNTDLDFYYSDIPPSDKVNKI